MSFLPCGVCPATPSPLGRAATESGWSVMLMLRPTSEHLRRRIVGSLERPNGKRNERLQRRNVTFSCQSWPPIHRSMARCRHITTPFGAVNFSSTILPVLRVSAGSKTRTSASSSAIVRCSTPRGTTHNSPASKITLWS